MQTDDRWPARVQGQPAGINPKPSAATYMWHDRDGWHVRVTHHTTNLKSFADPGRVGGLGNRPTLVVDTRTHQTALNRCEPRVTVQFHWVSLDLKA